MDEHPQTLDALKERIEHAREQLKSLIDGLSDEQIEARQDGAWAVADHLAHLAAWERGVADYLRGRSRAEGMGLTEAALALSTDEVNGLLFRKHATASATQARLLLHKAQEEMDEALGQLSDGDLQRNYGALLPGGQDASNAERTVLNVIRSNTYEHYEEHLATLRSKFE